MLRTIKNHKGVALMSTLFFMIIVTMIATGAILLSTVQMKVASSISRWERGFSTAEGAISYVIPLLQYAHFDSVIPSQYCGDMPSTTPCVVPPAVHALVNELHSTVESNDTQNLKVVAGSTSAFRNFDMVVDIDTVGTSVAGGGGVEASWAYHGGSYSSSLLRAYRVKSVAGTPGGSRTAVCQVVWLRAVM